MPMKFSCFWMNLSKLNLTKNELNFLIKDINLKLLLETARKE